jgi:ATP-dependent exoDNAse (exonuclease V) beta subunit
MSRTDEEARAHALSDLLSTVLVEAAAGTGKTSLLAGRIAMLLAGGVDPRNVVAITFTDLAASELAQRIRRFVDELLRGQVPRDMRAALPQGLSEPQRAALRRAQSRIDELTCSTIHGFCQELIRGYAVEADVDPGARVLDEVEADMLFEDAFERWLKRRLGAPARPGDPVAALSREDPRRIVGTLRELARFRRAHRTARPVRSPLHDAADVELADAVSEFRRWLASAPPEPFTADDVSELERLSAFYAGQFDPTPDFPTLWRLAHPPRIGVMRAKAYDLAPYRRKSKWSKVARADGERLNAEATALYDCAREAFRRLLGGVATALVAALSHELDEVLDEYRTSKRAAAVLDFDDLIHKARDLTRDHEDVRCALGRRYPRILVDEFQDTDPLQAEILFRVAGEVAGDRPWQDSRLCAGALFLVGDPKQAIYRFRGADVASYAAAKSVIERCFPGNVIQITKNFRSRGPILSHVNGCFRQPLAADGQPGYVELSNSLPEPGHGLPCVAKMTVPVTPQDRATELRDAEAAAVADLCRRLIGNVRIRRRDGDTEPLAPGDIALLAPTGTELWRYERALEARGLPIASQAGKGLFRRQEIQDLVALVRVLADGRDTLAFGALMRGPLVGLTEEELLDIAAALPRDGRVGQPRFSVMTDPALVAHPVAREVLSTLRELRFRSRTTVPMLLLSAAVERLGVRTALAARHGARDARAVANVDVLLERTRPYGVRGLKRLARDLDADWLEAESHEEGRVDSQGEAIELVTMHSAKGLEWPVVIPINAATELRRRDQFVYRHSDDTLHWVLGDVVPPELATALETEEEALARERERLWYVACTRAMELLIIPDVTAAHGNSWAKLVDLGLEDLPELDVAGFEPQPIAVEAEVDNLQTAETFQVERARVSEASPPLVWRRPSEHDPDRVPGIDVPAIEAEDPPELVLPVGGGRIRGLVLHKLLEEILIGELEEAQPAARERAQALLDQLREASDEAGTTSPDPDEMARTALKTLALPELAELKPGLVPELPVYGPAGQPPETLVAGRADAVAYRDGRAWAVVDWKSDGSPSAADRKAYLSQLRDYMTALGADRGAVVYATLGEIDWVLV